MGDASDSTDAVASRGRPKPSLRVVASDDAAVPERDPHPDWLAETRALARRMGEPGFAPGVDPGLFGSGHEPFVRAGFGVGGSWRRVRR
jgi:hypothetical protein